MVAFKAGAFAAFFAVGAVLALPEMYRWLKADRLSSLKTPLATAILVTLGLWLVSSLLSIHPTESLTKLLSTAAGGFVCFLLVGFFARKGLLKIFALSLLFATFVVGIVYLLHYIIGAHADPWLIKNGYCAPADGAEGWRRGDLQCLLAGNWLHFPYSFVSMAPILAILIVAFMAEYRAYRAVGLVTIGLFVLQALVVQQLVSVLFAVGIVAAGAVFLLLRLIPVADRKRVLNFGFGVLGIAALGSSWFVGNFTAERGERLTIPFRTDVPRLLVWQTALQKASERPFFGFGLNVGDYRLLDGRPVKTADLVSPRSARISPVFGYPGARYVVGYPLLDGRPVKPADLTSVRSPDMDTKPVFHYPGERLAEVQFIRSGDALYLVFPPMAAGGIFLRQIEKLHDFFSKEGREYAGGKFAFLDGEVSFAEVKKIAAPPSPALAAEIKFDNSKRGLTAHSSMVMVGDRDVNVLVSAGGTSHVYSGLGSDLIVVQRGAEAILWDAFANEKTPFTCWRFRLGTWCARPGGRGDEDVLLFPDHEAEELTFRLEGDDLLVFDGPGADPMVTVVGYKRAFALGALGGWFEDRLELKLPASLAASAAEGKPKWGSLADPSFALKGKPSRRSEADYYRVDEGYVQHYPHNWLFEALVDTGYPATAALLIALALWFRYWLMHPSNWAWLPALLGFTWWLECLVNFSLWLNWWQFYFLLPAAFATAWVRVEGEGDKTLWRMLTLPKKRATG